jgi:hypothetical protein
MTKISMISGIGDIDISAKLKSKMTEISQKREYITPQEDIPLKGSVGEARAYLLKRQLELLRAFNIDDRAKVEDYNKSIRAVETAIVKGPTKFVISGTAYGDVEAQVKNIINTKLKDDRPAMSYKNTYQGMTSQSRVGNIPMNVLLTKDLVVEGQGCTTLIQRDLCYRLGASTTYKKSADVLVPIIMKYLNDNLNKPILDANGNPVTRTTNVFGRIVTYNLPKYTIDYQGKNAQQLLPILNSQGNMQKMLTLFAPSSGAFPISFGDVPTKLDFEKYVEEQSGVWQQYLNQTVFKESGGVGAGVLYNYADNTGIPLGKFGSVINSKKAVQSQWMAGMNYLTGADQSIINDMGRNTYIFKISENPEDSLKKLAAASGITPSVGLDPVTVTLIIGLITAVLSAVPSIMAACKRDADRLAPEKALGVSPIGSPLMPDEGDWDNTDTFQDPNNPQGGGEGGNGDGGTGMNTNTLLALGLLGVGGYFLMKKGKK